MTTVAALLRRFETVNVQTDLTDAIEQTGPDYAKANADQMFAGKLNDGQDITPPYAVSTVQRKKRKSQPYDRVTLRDTETMQSKIEIQVDNDKLLVGSDTDYSKYVEARYSSGPESNIFGLGGDYKGQYVSGALRPTFQKIIEDKTQLKFK
jgi:hypothetical protein